jgi:putative addiction module component (TIGR02574 family)
MTKEQIISEAMELVPAERQTLAEELLLSIDETDQEKIDQAWLEEVRGRDAAFQRGEMSASPVEEVLNRIRTRNG